MSVVHILKDGSVVKDITGRVVRIEDAVPLYQLLDTISRDGSRKSAYNERLKKVRVC